MKRTRGILAAAILLAVLAAGVWIFSQPEKSVVIKGNISAQDVREIKQAVKNAMRKEVFPSFSWANLTAFPGRARWYFQRHVRSIEVIRPGQVMVQVETGSGMRITRIDAYYVEKGAKDWSPEGSPHLLVKVN